MSKEVHDREKNQATEKRSLYDSPAFAAQHRHADVEKKNERANDDQVVKRERDLQERLAFGPAEDESHEGSHARGNQQSELKIGESGTEYVALGFFGHHEVSAAHEAKEQPQDQEIRMKALVVLKGTISTNPCGIVTA